MPSHSSYPPPSDAWVPGTLIPGTVYRVIRPIGRGGMGEVYEVEHDLLGSTRALKVLAKQYAHREDLTERLRIEARGLARLKHPNIVEVYDLGTAADGRIFFAMELLEGATLRSMLRHRGRLSTRTSVEIILQVLSGLQASHELGLVHRDVKPENIFVCRDGVVKLLDFGVAKIIDAWMPQQQITALGMTVGTPRYMSPEQAEGEPVDGRTDVYSAGQVLWEMLAGQPAFVESDLIELVLAKRRGLSPLTDIPGTDVSAVLSEAVIRACRPNPPDRHLSAREFEIALREAIDEVETAVDIRYAKTSPDFSHATDTTTAVRVAPRIIQGICVTSDVQSPVSARPGNYEPTERLDVAEVDPDDPTRVSVSSVRYHGPHGTEMLPGAAAERKLGRKPDQKLDQKPDQIAEGKVAANSSPNTPSVSVVASIPQLRGRRMASFLGISAASWAIGGVSFLLPTIAMVFVILHYQRVQAESPQPSGASGALARGISESATVPVPAASAAPEVDSGLDAMSP